MSTGERRKVSPEDIQMVQNLIEQCLAHYMTKEQVIDILHQQQNIEPGFTELVWQKLEEQNQEFFKIYRLRLVLTKQITEFNSLLRRQAALMKQLDPHGVAFRPVSNGSHIPASKLPVSNGSHIPPMHHSSSFFTFENNGIHIKTGNMQQPVPTVLSSGFNNHGPSINSEMPHALDMFTQSRRFDVPLNMMLADQNSNVGSVQGMNRLAIKTEPGYLSNPSFAHQTGGHVMEAHATMDFASTSSYHIMDSNSCQLNGTLLNNTSYSDVLRNLSQSQNVGIRDTTSDFNSLDVQRFYMSAFPLPDGDNIWNHHGSRIENQGENRMLHDISGSLRFQYSG